MAAAGRGLGPRLCHRGGPAALRHGFETLTPPLEEIVSFTVPANARSRRVMERLGMTHAAEDDFDHSQLPEGHRLRRHVLYRIRRDDWRRSAPEGR